MNGAQSDKNLPRSHFSAVEGRYRLIADYTPAAGVPVVSMRRRAGPVASISAVVVPNAFDASGMTPKRTELPQLAPTLAWNKSSLVKSVVPTSKSTSSTVAKNAPAFSGVTKAATMSKLSDVGGKKLGGDGKSAAQTGDGKGARATTTGSTPPMAVNGGSTASVSGTTGSGQNDGNAGDEHLAVGTESVMAASFKTAAPAVLNPTAGESFKTASPLAPDQPTSTAPTAVPKTQVGALASQELSGPSSVASTTGWSALDPLRSPPSTGMLTPSGSTTKLMGPPAPVVPKSPSGEMYEPIVWDGTQDARSVLNLPDPSSGLMLAWLGDSCLLVTEALSTDDAADQLTRLAGVPKVIRLNPRGDGDAIEAAIGFGSGDLLVADIVTGKTAAHLNWDDGLGLGGVITVAWAPEPRTILSIHEKGVACIWKVGLSGVTKLAQGADAVVEIPSSGMPPPPKTNGRGVDGGVATWKVSAKSINGDVYLARQWVFHVGGALATRAAFAPDGETVAIGWSDGAIRVYVWPTGELKTELWGYFGSMMSVAWSPDGAYIAGGGEDDTVTIWSMGEEVDVVARGVGHGAWVSDVAWDGCFRLGSVGFDAQLALWDFSLETLPRTRRDTPPNLLPRVRGDGVIVVPAPPPGAVPEIEPVSIHRVHREPIAEILFLDEVIVIVCVGGHVKVWARPELLRRPRSESPDIEGDDDEDQE